MSDSPLLEAVGISKRYGPTQALDDVSLSLAEGRVLALLGENGAGKSTLVKILSGVVTPDTGQVTLAGDNLAGRSRAAVQSGIHLVHQEFALLQDRTVVENVFLGRELRSPVGTLRWKQMRILVEHALAELGADDIAPTAHIRDLPTGSQQMVEIARAIVGQARVVILDEPTAALSPGEAKKLFEVIRRMTARGVSIVYISHRLDEIVKIADTVTVLKDGRHVATRPIDELTISDMVALMVGRELEDLFPAYAPLPVSEATPALEVRALVDPGVVSEASFTVQAGEIVGIYGIEGHGQDELLACLAGDRRPASGSLTVSGKPARWGSVRAQMALGFGFVPADRKTEGLILNFSGNDNIVLPIMRERIATAGLISRHAESTIAQPNAVRAGIRGTMTAPVGGLSGGNQQKVLLARLLAAESTVLLLNQPTRGVDVGAKAEIYELIRQTCRDQGRAAVVVSREISELQGLCDRILVMSHGRLAGEHPRDASEAEILSTAVGATS